MLRKADLTPPLGSPGGPCRVVQRIYDRVSDPNVRGRLVQEVETGIPLRNPEAAKIYDLTVAPLAQGLFKRVLIGPHAGYRMDLRTISVKTIQRSVQNFVRAMEVAESRGDPAYDFHREVLMQGRATEWNDPRMRVTVILALTDSVTAKVVTAYWTGRKDPPPPLKHCPVPRNAAGYREPASALPGVQTFVQNPDGTQDRDPEYLAPSNPDGGKAHTAPKSRSRSFPQPRGINGPPASGESADGKSLSQDKVRTKGQPGEEYGTPSLNWNQEGPTRRTMKADFFMERAPALGPDPTLRYDRATKALQPPHGESGHGLNIHEVTEAPGSAKVIPSGQGFVNKEAFKIGQIESLCSPELRQKSRGLNVKLRRVDAANSMKLYDVQGSGSEPYRVKVKFIAKSKNLRDPMKVDVQVSCSCPFWQWQGPEHHASINGYLFGKARGTASSPNVKDPSGHHGACKHTLAVLQAIKGTALPGRGRKTASSWRWGSAWGLRQETLIQRVARRYIEGRG